MQKSVRGVYYSRSQHAAYAPDNQRVTVEKLPMSGVY